MIVVVALDDHFLRTPDGNVWTQSVMPYRFWQRYLDVFEGVRVVARVRDVPAPPTDYLRVDGPCFSIAAVPDYRGPWQYLRHRKGILEHVEDVVEPGDAVILRVPSQVSTCVHSRLRRSGHPYGVEVLGDPWDVFAPGAVQHPLRPLFRLYGTCVLKSQCANAHAAAYVTERALQKRYPRHRNRVEGLPLAPDGRVATSPTMSIGISDVILPSAAVVSEARSYRTLPDPLSLVFVGTMAQLYKAPDILIQAVARTIRSGVDLRLVLVGDGRYRPQLELLARQLGICDRVLFRGQLTTGAAVREKLDQADLFVLPSHQEGLPRAMVEAMARAMPCIGSSVGGIPELLASEDLVPPGNAAALAEKIIEVATNPGRMRAMSLRNLERARDFQDHVLQTRRVEFYRFLKERTEEWIDQKNCQRPRRCAA